MSKDKVEIGDVWRNNRFGDLLYITEVGTNFIDFIGYSPYNKDNPYFVNHFSNVRNDERYTRFTEFYTYLGKSKANINDLFKTENEE